MPIQKFRSVEEMPDLEWTDPKDERLLDRLRKLSARWAQLIPRSYPRGIFKFRTVEEAQQARERLLEQDLQRLRPSHQT